MRIDIVKDQPISKLLRIGLSVEATIHTNLEDIVAIETRHGQAAP